MLRIRITAVAVGIALLDILTTASAQGYFRTK